MIKKLASVALLGSLMTSIAAPMVNAEGVLTIGRREDSSTFDPINTAQNIDFWCSRTSSTRWSGWTMPART